MTGLALKALAIGLLLWGFYAAWHHEREAYKDAAVAVIEKAVKDEADRDWKDKLATAEKRTASAEAARVDATIRLANMKEVNDAKDRAIANGIKLIAGLRATAVVARRNEVRSDPGSACYAQELRSEQLAAAGEDLQRRSIAVAERANRIAGFLLECDAGSQTDAIIIEWWRRYAGAIQIGAEPPPAPPSVTPDKILEGAPAPL